MLGRSALLYGTSGINHVKHHSPALNNLSSFHENTEIRVRAVPLMTDRK